MSETTEVAKVTTKSFFEKPEVQGKFKELLGKKSQQFITSILQITATNSLLAKADPKSIYGAAITAAILDLPIQNNLGFAYIVPYVGAAQFQIGWKGLVQLAIRSGQFESISTCEIYEGQIVSENPLTGYVFDFSKKASDTIIGYAAYFKLLSGYSKVEYMSVAQIEAHAKRFSQTYKNGQGVWKDNFSAMAKKTILKLTLSRYAPLSVQMQTAFVADQSITDGDDYEYSDNKPEVSDQSEKAAKLFGNALNTTEAEVVEPETAEQKEESFLEQPK